jgi:hypothetical protein
MPAQLSHSVRHRLNIYALAATGAAGLGVLATPQVVEGKIIYTPADTKLGLDTPLGVDLNHDGVIDFFLLKLPFRNPPFGLALSACHAVFNNGSLSYCVTSSAKGSNGVRIVESGTRSFGAALFYGGKVQRGDRFRRRHRVVLGSFTETIPSHTRVQWFGPWANDGKGVKDRYLGVRFEIKGEMHFGWMRLTVSTQSGYFNARLTGYAYETVPGKGIVAGETRGPDAITLPAGSLGALARGRK